MTLPPRRPSIDDIGLKQYLTDTAELHKGFSYEHFVAMLNPQIPEEKVDKANMARAFGVGRHTIYKWIDIYNREAQR